MLNLERRLDEVVVNEGEARRMEFNNPDPDLHDVMLVVGEREFYCSKIPLAKHSPFFYNLFFPDGEKSTQREFKINAPVSQETFLSFLNTCYGITCISDGNVLEIFSVAKLWEAEIVMDRCWDWLVGSETQTTDKEKFKIGIDGNWEKLKLHVLSKANTQDELDAIVPSDLEDLDHHTMSMILERSLKIGGIWPPRVPQPRQDPAPRPAPNPAEGRRQVIEHLEQLENLRDESNSEFSTDEEFNSDEDDL